MPENFRGGVKFHDFRVKKLTNQKILSISTLSKRTNRKISQYPHFFSVISTFAYFIFIYTFESSEQVIVYQIYPFESQVDIFWVNKKSAGNVKYNAYFNDALYQNNIDRKKEQKNILI